MKRYKNHLARVGGRSGRRGGQGLPMLECLESRVLLSATVISGDHSGGSQAPITVAPVTVTEADTTIYATVTATLSLSHAANVHYATVNGTAKSGVNFTATSGSLAMTPGETSTFTIPILANDVSQGTTKFKVKLSIGGSVVQDTVTILGNDQTPTVTTSDLSVNAGNSTQTVSIPVTLSNPSATPVKIAYATQDGTAVKGKDYQQAKGTLTIPAGATTGIIKVKVLKDTAGETDKAFNVVLSSAANASLTIIANGTQYSRIAIHNAVGTIPTQPTLTVSDATALSGNTETFNVTLSAASAQNVSVRYHTIPGTATSADYTPVDGILTIPAGSTTGAITVSTGSIGDLASAAFTLALSAPANADLASTVATGTIIGTLPALGTSNASVTKTDSGTSTLAFTVTLSSAEPFPVSVNYATSDGTALAGTDYTAASGTLTFTPGQTSQTVDVTVDGNSNIQLDKTMTLTLSNAANATLSTATATGTILNNDFPAVAIGSAAVAEVGGDATTQTMTFTVTLSSAAPFPVTVNYATADVNALAGTDYTAANGTLTFTPGQTSQTISVTVTGDSVAPGETFDVNLSDAANATVSTGTGVGTIYYAEGGTDLSDNLSASSGAYYPVTTNLARAASFTTGSSMMSVTGITLSLQMSQPGSPTLMIYNDNSGSPGSLVGTLTSPGSFSSSGYANATFTTDGILLNADSTYWVVLQSTGEMDWNASASSGTGSGFTGISKVPSGSAWQLDVGNPPLMQVMAATVTDGPGVSIAPASATEVVGTDTTMAYTVTLDNPASFPVTVQYATSDGTAAAGTDYTAASGTITFAPGETSQTINVTVTGDASASDETLNMTLSNATNATITTAAGVGTITYGGIDLSDNLALAPASSDADIPFYNSQWIAASFATGSSSANLSTITLFMVSTGPSTATAMIYSDSGGHPGSLVGTLTSPATYPSSWNMATFTTTGITLDASTTYWVVMTGSSYTYEFAWGLSSDTSGTGIGFTGSQALYSQNNGSSWAGAGYTPIMQVAVKPLTDVSDNLAQSAAGYTGLSSTQWDAASFTTGSSSMDLTSVTVPLNMLSAGSVTMMIYSDATGAPGSLVGTLTSPGSYSSGSAADATFTASGITLSANTTYWVVMSASSGTFGWEVTTSGIGTGSGFTGASAVSTDLGSSWFGNDTFQMQVLAS